MKHMCSSKSLTGFLPRGKYLWKVLHVISLMKYLCFAWFVMFGSQAGDLCMLWDMLLLCLELRIFMWPRSTLSPYAVSVADGNVKTSKTENIGRGEVSENPRRFYNAKCKQMKHKSGEPAAYCAVSVAGFHVLSSIAHLATEAHWTILGQPFSLSLNYFAGLLWGGNKRLMVRSELLKGRVKQRCNRISYNKQGKWAVIWLPLPDAIVALHVQKYAKDKSSWPQRALMNHEVGESKVLLLRIFMRVAVMSCKYSLNNYRVCHRRFSNPGARCGKLY